MQHACSENAVSCAETRLGGLWPVGNANEARVVLGPSLQQGPQSKGPCFPLAVGLTAPLEMQLGVLCGSFWSTSFQESRGPSPPSSLIVLSSLCVLVR